MRHFFLFFCFICSFSLFTQELASPLDTSDVELQKTWVDSTYNTLSLKESKKVREYDYVEATYENVVTQFEW